MKKFLSILTALLIVAAFPAMSFAGRNTSGLPYVYDEASIPLETADSQFYGNGGFDINQGYPQDPVAPPGGYYYQEDSLSEKLGPGLAMGGIIGIVAGAISHGSAKKSMKTVAKAYSARNYLDTNSLRLNDVRDIFLYRTESRTRIQTSSPSSRGPGGHGGGGGHPGGRSSFSGGHMSSGGVHHSGGGRHF